MEPSKDPTPISKSNSTTVRRIFQQGSEIVSFYSDVIHVLNTGNEFVLQFYETIPGVPNAEGHVDAVNTFMRASITISIPHFMQLFETISVQRESMLKQMQAVEVINVNKSK